MHDGQNRGKGKRREATADAKSDNMSACSQNQKSVTGEAQARQENKVDLLVSVTGKGTCLKNTRIATAGIPIGKDMTGRRVRHAKVRENGFELDREKQSRRIFSAGSPCGEHLCKRKSSAPEGNRTRKRSPMVSSRHECHLKQKCAPLPVATSHKGRQWHETDPNPSNLKDLSKGWTWYLPDQARHKSVETPHRAPQSEGLLQTCTKQTPSSATLQSKKRIHPNPKPVVKSKERRYFVDSVFLHMMGEVFSTQEKKNLRQTKNCFEIQTASGIVRSTKEARAHIQELGTHLYVVLVENSPSIVSLGRL